jgi:hypothetical protein
MKYVTVIDEMNFFDEAVIPVKPREALVESSGEPSTEGHVPVKPPAFPRPKSGKNKAKKRRAAGR